jgi:nucleotide-binding universal stress UspA family protein
MRKGILVPFDGSANSLEALHVAITLAEALGEKIILLNVQPCFHTVHTKLLFSEREIREYQEQLSATDVEKGKELLAASKVEYTVKMRTGDPKTQICQEANADHPPNVRANIGVRLIVMGSRGMNPVVGGMLGSVSYGVVNAAPCPVTIVPYSCVGNK